MRDKIKLVSSAGTGHFYTTTKNKRTMTEKMEIKKYDPVVRKHVIYKEAKIKQSKNVGIGICPNIESPAGKTPGFFYGSTTIRENRIP